MAMSDDLAELSQRLHCNVVLPLPPICREIVERARADGIRFGNVYVVCRPLQPGVQGSYDRETRDLWCHYDSSLGEEGQRALVQSVLSMLASLHQGFPRPATIEDDWYQLRQAHQGGFALAQAWGLDAFFTDADQQCLQERDRHHYRCHLAAGEIAGHPDPFVARSAYFALQGLRGQYGWTDRQFEEALSGTSDDRAANSLVACFDRLPLRRRWLVTHTRRPDEIASFGEAAMTSPHAGLRLRDAMARAFEHRLAQEANLAPVLLSAQSHSWCARAESTQQLAVLVALLNTWLIDDYPHAAVRMHWWCYADERREGTTPLHLYRGEITYEEDQALPQPLTRTLWVLFGVPQHLRNQTIEAAWQHVVISWLAFAELRCAPLAEGLHALWSTFQD